MRIESVHNESRTVKKPSARHDEESLIIMVLQASASTTTPPPPTTTTTTTATTSDKIMLPIPMYRLTWQGMISSLGLLVRREMKKRCIYWSLNGNRASLVLCSIKLLSVTRRCASDRKQNHPCNMRINVLAVVLLLL